MDELSVLHQIVPDHPVSVPEYREWICDIENRMNETGVSVDRHSTDHGFGLNHIFTPGLYTRQITMPKNSLVISRIHLFEHPFIITSGKVSVYDGEQIVTLEAPYTGITKPGTKRILFCHEDTVWSTFHATDKRSLEEVDVNCVITCDSFDEFERIVHKEIEIWHG